VSLRSDPAAGLSFPIGQGLAGSVAQDGIMLHADDVSDPVLFDPEVDFVFDKSTTRNVLSIPVFDRQGVSPLLFLYRIITPTHDSW
jgi:hypothetical protein